MASVSGRALLGFLLLAALVLTMSSRSQATTYATWIMVWYGHDQAWWKPDNADASRMLLEGQWKTLDWADDSQFSAHLDGIKRAGVTVVIADLTNGWHWLDGRCRQIQALCAKKGMQFCVAENSSGNTAQFERHAKDIWDNFAGPDAPNHSAYFRYRGKSLIVCYAVRDWFRAYLKMDTPFRSRFSLVWASGEDSCINKWGWQLEPWIGSVPSADSMFVTSAVRWNPAEAAMWRKSLAWLDYNFALARKHRPKHIIIGAYDDPTERNTWMVTDTSHCEPGRQMRDKTGALNPSAHYDRVREWISGKPSAVPGGSLLDGAYRMVNRVSGKQFRILNAEKPDRGAPRALLGESAKGSTTTGLFWLYHLGGNHYRIIAVHSGLALEASDGSIIQNWESTDSKQRWTVTRTSDGCFRLKNDATGEALAADRGSAILRPPGAGQDQQWRLRPGLTL